VPDSDLGNGLGDEELMTVQGLDGYGDYSEYGALYQAPDGSLYQVQGLAESPDPLGEGVPGEVRQGPDGRAYQWVQGYDGLGEPVGFWFLAPLARAALARAALPLAARFLPQLLRAGGAGGAAQILQRVLPQAASFLQQVPPQAAAPSVPAASDELTGVGALYQAPDGSLYQVQGFAEDERLAEDELIRGLDEDERLAEDELIRGLDEDERYGEDEALRGVEGYVRENGVHGMDAYVAPEGPQTRAFIRPAQAPPMWRPLW
jgi:hypothetical protein